MKLKTTIFSILICLLCFSFSASAQWCGIAANGKYEWKIETTPTSLIVTVHPLTLTNIGFFNIYPTPIGGGHGLTASGSNRTITLNRGAIATGTNISFHFLYNGTGIVGQEQSETFNYTVGASCESASNIKPEIVLYPAIGAPFTSPASVLLRALATDEDGTITKVEFYNGALKIGETTSGNEGNYYFTWENVQPGEYTITAKATDNQFGVTTSNPMTVTVGGEFTNEWCGESAGAAVPTTGNEFQWKAETVGNTVIVTFRGIGGAAGVSGNNSVILNGVYMTDAGSGNLTRTITGQNTGNNLNLSFTYNRPVAGGQNNSNGNPITYVVGTQCAMSTLPVSLIGFNSKTQPDGTISLNWATATESNNSYFLLERSATGTNFNELTKIYSKDGNSSSRLDYQFTDKNPVSGNNYYRLSQFDNDGKSQELGLRVERISGMVQSNALHPNPLTGTTLNVAVNGQDKGEVTVTITSISGLEIYKGTVAVSSGSVQVQLPSKPASGVYLVKVGNQQIHKLLVD